MGQNFKNGAKKKNGYASYARQMRVKYAWILCRNPRVIYKWRVRVKCASYARQGRVNLVPESARLLQMTRTRIPRVDTRDLPEAQKLAYIFHCHLPYWKKLRNIWGSMVLTHVSKYLTSDPPLIVANLDSCAAVYDAVSGHVESLSQSVIKNLTLHRVNKSFLFTIIMWRSVAFQPCITLRGVHWVKMG